MIYEYVPSFRQISSGIRKLIGGGGIHREHADLISLLLFYSKLGK
jgi:hypothetical protein